MRSWINHNSLFVCSRCLSWSLYTQLDLSLLLWRFLWFDRFFRWLNTNSERRGGAGGPRGDRGDRQERGDRGDRQDRGDCGDRQDRGERVDRPPRRERPEAPAVSEPVPQPTPTTGEVAAPVVDAETSSPSGKPRFTRGPQQPQQHQRGNNNQRRGPREGPGGPSRVGQKAAPKFDDEKDFPSLGK